MKCAHCGNESASVDRFLLMCPECRRKVVGDLLPRRSHGATSTLLVALMQENGRIEELRAELRAAATILKSFWKAHAQLLAADADEYAARVIAVAKKARGVE